MLEAIGSKIIAGIVSLSMFLFSSYTGNDPAMRPLQIVIGRSYVQIKTGLTNAFVNDFNDVFRSGTTIPVEFTVTIRSGRTVFVTNKYTNTVTYDPMTGLYTIAHNATGQRIRTPFYQSMIVSVSQFECSIPYQPAWKRVTIKVDAGLSEVHFAQIDRTVDLTVLWKYIRPSSVLNADLSRSS